MSTISVKKRDRETPERLVRRFNRDVQLSGILSYARKKIYREPELSKQEKRTMAIRKRRRRELKLRNFLFGT